MRRVSLPVLKRIEMGGVRNSELLTGMVVDGISIGPWFSIAVRELPIIISPKRIVTFADCVVGDLGFTEMPTQEQLWGRAEELYGLCTEDAPMYLRREFKDQSLGECRFVISRPIAWPPPEGKSIVRLGCGRKDGFHRQLRLQICPVEKDAHLPLEQKITLMIKEEQIPEK